MKNAMEASDLIASEEAILQEKDCVSIDDSSLPAAQVLMEQTERVNAEDSGAPLFIP